MEFSGILSGKYFSYCLLAVDLLQQYRSHVRFNCQIAKLSIIPVSCLLEVFFDKIRYSRDTKLSIGVVLLGVGVCTVTDVSVNAKGFIAAFIAVWSTSLQQYVSVYEHLFFFTCVILLNFNLKKFYHCKSCS